MNLGAQDVIAIILVMASGVYLLHQVRGAFFGGAKRCGGCGGGCEGGVQERAKGMAKPVEFVSLTSKRGKEE